MSMQETERIIMCGSKTSCKNISGHKSWLLDSLSLHGSGYGMASTGEVSHKMGVATVTAAQVRTLVSPFRECIFG